MRKKREMIEFEFDSDEILEIFGIKAPKGFRYELKDALKHVFDDKFTLEFEVKLSAD